MLWSNPRTLIKYKHYETFIAALVQAQGLERAEMAVRKGSFLIWSSNLLHGGSPIVDRTTTRRSQVTHYFFEGVIPITPMFSNAHAGEYFLRTLRSVTTGEPLLPTFNGRAIELQPGSIRGLARFRVR